MAHLADDAAGPRGTVKGARAALVLLLLINLFNYIDRQVLAAVETRIGEELLPGATDVRSKMGALATAFLLSYMVFSPMFGRMAVRWSRWALVGFGVALWSLASGASGLAGTYGMLLLTRCLVGIGEAAYGPIAPSLIADMFPVERRGRVLAWFYAAIPVGSALGYALGGGMSALAGWRSAFYAVVLPGLALAVWAFMKKDVRGEGGSQKTEVRTELEAAVVEPAVAVAVADTGGTPVPHRRTLWHDLGELVRIKSYVLDCVGMTFMTFAIGGIAFFMPRYLMAEGAGDEGKVGLWFGAISASAGLMATLAGGWLGDKLRSRIPGSYFLVSAAGLGIGFPLFLATLWAPLPWKWGLLFLTVFALFFNTGPSNTILANVAPARLRTTAFAVNIFVIHAFGDAVSPVLIGWVADRADSIETGFLVASVTFLLGAIFWALGMPHLKADTERAEADAAAAGRPSP